MKKIFVFAIAITSSLSCIAQNVSIANKVSIRSSDGIKKVNEQDLKLFINEKFGSDKMALNAANAGVLHDNHLYDSYLKNDILVFLSYTDTDKESKDTFLEDMKELLKDMSRRTKDYSSVIKKLNNNNTVLITNYWINNTGYYYFICNNSDNTKGFNGRLLFNKIDKDKATNILNDLLADVKFN